MFNWRNRNDGFSWEKHIKTTVLYRRAKRRENLANARESAAEGVMKVGQAGRAASIEGAVIAKKGAYIAAEGVKKAGLAGRAASIEGAVIAKKGAFKAAEGVGAASVWVWSSGKLGSARALQASWSATKYVSEKVWYASLTASDYIVAISLYVSEVFSRFLTSCVHALEDRGVLQPKVAMLVGGIGFVIALCAAFLFGSNGFNGITMLAMLGAIPLLALAILSITHHNDIKVAFPLPAKLRTPMAARFAGFTVLGCLTASLFWAGYQYLPTSSGFNVTSLVTSTPAEVFKGRATALTGDTLRISGRVVKLYGIEAPDVAQRCNRSRSKTWRCGIAAKSALRGLVGRSTVRCTRVGTTQGDQPTTKCSTDRRGDLAAALVSRGHVFAEQTFMNSYSDLEEAAREKKIGIWRGKTLRPAEYREAKWNAAKKARPDGCPIKGRILRSGRRYVLPWSPSYRKVRVRNSRGERWFCSEEEAITAGWQPSDRS